jgi:uncharacterized protein (DUF305 family)
MAFGVPGAAVALDAASSASKAAPEPVAVTPKHGATLDRAFLYGMAPHHQAAIDMARVELKRGHNPTVQKLARSIITSQSTEIREMDTIATHQYGFTPPRELTGPMGELMGVPLSMDMSMMGSMLASMPGTDHSFLQMMIPHHASAIGMANEEQTHGANPRLKTMAAAIISSQAGEIGQMEALLGHGV